MTRSVWMPLLLIVVCRSQHGETTQRENENYKLSYIECSGMKRTYVTGHGRPENEITCKISNTAQYRIQVVKDLYCNVQCTNITNMSMEDIRPLDLGPTARMKLYFQFKNCPLPADPKSYADIVKHLGVKNTNQIKIQNIYLNTSIERKHLRGIDELKVKYLNLYNSNIRDIPEDLFQDVPNLLMLELSTNKLRLPGRVFKDLKKLRVLMASNTELTNIPEDLFALPALEELFLDRNSLNLTSHTFHGSTSLKTLYLGSNSLITLPQDLFRESKNLQNVTLSNNKLQKLPDYLFINNAKLINIDLANNRLKTISPMLFGKLQNLATLNVSHNLLSNLPDGVFSNLSLLIEIQLEYNNLEKLPGRIFSNQTALKRLNLSYNQLKSLPETIFEHLRSLEELHLNNNLIGSLGSKNFNGLDKLKTLNLQFNHLSSLDFPQTGLHILKLNASCNLLTQLSELRSKLAELEILDLRNNSIYYIDNDWQHYLNNLAYLNISYNKINISSFAEHLHFTNNRAITVDLTHNSISRIDWPDYNEHHLWHGGHNVDIIINDNPIICDCDLYYVVQHQKNTSQIDPRVKIIAENTKCANSSTLTDRLLSDINLDDLTCARNVEECLVIKKPHTKARIVNCSHGHLNTHRPLILAELPIDYNHTELVLEYNNLKSLAFMGKIPKDVTVLKLRGNSLSLGDHDIPDNIEELDLRGNHLTYINKSVAENILGGSESRKVKISQNSFVCDCDNYYFLSLVIHSHKVQDYNLTTCSNGTPLKEINLGYICKQTIPVVLGVLGAITIIVTIFYCRYQIALKAWLARNVPWMRKYILPSVSVNDVEDFKKDVFVSYSNFNVEDVAGTLLPLLERLHYTTLYHQRDWVPGMPILKSIENSVRESQTTIFFVTPEFVKSEWSCHEFMVAFARQVNECSANIIVIFKGDIDLIAKKNKDIRAYIKTRTYLKWDDPSFENKLTLALPERLAVKVVCENSDDIKISPINVIVHNAPNDAANDISS